MIAEIQDSSITTKVFIPVKPAKGLTVKEKGANMRLNGCRYCRNAPDEANFAGYPVHVVGRKLFAVCPNCQFSEVILDLDEIVVDLTEEVKADASVSILV